MDLETSQVAAHHFGRLPISRQQREVTAKSADGGENYPIQEYSGQKCKTATITQVTVRQAARLPIGRQQRGATSAEKNKQFDPGG